jgi:predicted aspartyl protease
MTLKEQILSAKRKIESVPENELGLTVFLRRMTGGERDIYIDAIEKGTVTGYLILALTLCDENGARLFENPDELKALDHTVIDRLALKAMEINGFTRAAREAVEKKVAAEKTVSGSTLPTN